MLGLSSAHRKQANHNQERDQKKELIVTVGSLLQKVRETFYVCMHVSIYVSSLWVPAAQYSDVIIKETKLEHDIILEETEVGGGSAVMKGVIIEETKEVRHNKRDQWRVFLYFPMFQKSRSHVNVSSI